MGEEQDTEAELREDSGARGRPRIAAERASVGLGGVDAKMLVMAAVLFVGGGGGTFAGHVVTSGPSEELRRKVDDIDKKLEILLHDKDAQGKSIDGLAAQVSKQEDRILAIELTLAKISPK